MHESKTDRNILVVDHNPEHVATIQRVLNQNGQNYRLNIFERGEQAIEFLHRDSGDRAWSHPDLILLDLDLPDQEGRAMLSTLKTNPNLKRIPIVVFTLSDSSTDILYAYANQGNCYVVKSMDLEQLSEIIQQIKDFWFGIVTLPLE